MANALYYGDNLDVLRDRENFPDGRTAARERADAQGRLL